MIRSSIATVVILIAMLCCAPVFAQQPAETDTTQVAATNNDSKLPQYTMAQYLAIKHAKGGQFSADEKSVLYLSNDSGTYQLWKVSVKGGDPVQLTRFDDPVEGFECDPKSNRLVFLKDKGGDENYQMYLLDIDNGAPKLLVDAPKSRFRSPKFSPDGTRLAFTANLRDQRYFDPYVLDLGGGEPKLVREVDAYNLIEAWRPDGKALVVVTWDHNYNNNLRLLEVETGEATLLTPHTGWAVYEDVVWPDTEKGQIGFYVLSNLGQQFMKLAFLKVEKQVLEVQDTAIWDSEMLRVSADGRIIGYTLNVQGYSQMILIDTKKERFWAKPYIPMGVIKSLRISRNGDRILYSFSSPINTTDIWMFDVKTGKNIQLTKSSTGDISPATFVSPELVQFNGANGAEIPGFLYKPIHGKADGTLPGIVYLHGGPSAQERPDFSSVFQYFLNRGFVIFAPNVRGSSGYGKAFAYADDGDKRKFAVMDAALGVQWLIDSKAVHPDRIGVMGGSYGGFMVLSLMTEYPKKFAAGVDVVGISNFVTFLQRTHASRRTLREAEYGYLESDRLMLERISPIHKIDKIRGALMVIHGAKDPRVPLSEAEQVVEKAKQAGLNVEYLVYPDEGHGLSKLKNKLDAYPKMADFFEKYLAMPKAETPENQDTEPSPSPAPEAAKE